MAIAEQAQGTGKGPAGPESRQRPSEAQPNPSPSAIRKEGTLWERASLRAQSLPLRHFTPSQRAACENKGAGLVPLGAPGDRHARPSPSSLQPPKATDMIERHRDGVMAYWIHSATRAPSEGLNSVASAIKRKPPGFRSTKKLIARIYFTRRSPRPILYPLKTARDLLFCSRTPKPARNNRQSYHFPTERSQLIWGS
jgi:hypothetical protein